MVTTMDRAVSISTRSYNFGARQAVRIALCYIAAYLVAAILSGALVFSWLPSFSNTFGSNVRISSMRELDAAFDKRDFFITAKTSGIWDTGYSYSFGANGIVYTYFVTELDGIPLLIFTDRGIPGNETSGYNPAGLLRKADKGELPLLEAHAADTGSAYSAGGVSYVIDMTRDRFAFTVIYYMMFLLEGFFAASIVIFVLRTRGYRKGRWYLAMGYGNTREADRINSLVSEEIPEGYILKRGRLTVTQSFIICRSLLSYAVYPLESFQWFFPVGRELLPHGEKSRGPGIMVYHTAGNLRIPARTRKEAGELYTLLCELCPSALTDYSDKTWTAYKHDYKSFLEMIES